MQSTAGPLRAPFDAMVDALSRSVPAQLRSREWAAGYGVLGVHFESGDLIALRHFPHSAIGAYSTVWHRSAEGIWRMYFDAPRSDLACPRYFSGALFDTERASIELAWPDDHTLDVRAHRRHLVDLFWRIRLGTSARTSLINIMSRLMPSRLTTTPAVLNAMARGSDALLGMGGFRASGASPNGQRFMLRPKWMAPIDSSSATLNNGDLGRMTTATDAAALGEFVIPRRPLFAAGWAFFDAPSMLTTDEPSLTDAQGGSLPSKYVCQRLVSRVVESAHRGTFGGERTFATVMFIDINGFTGLSERCEPERVMQILNRNLEIVVDTIFRYDGAVLKFLGDGILAAFGVHRRRNDDVNRAAMAALEIQANIRAAQAVVPDDERVTVAIGVHCGQVVCGNIGHRDRLDFTIIGDTVNVAQRIQSLAQPDEPLISSEVARAIDGGFVVQDRRDVSVKGREESVRVYTLVDAALQ